MPDRRPRRPRQIEAPWPQFLLGGHNELLEFEDVEAAVVPPDEAASGVVAKHGNWALVRLRLSGALPVLSVGQRPPVLTLVVDTAPDATATASTGARWQPLTVRLHWPSVVQSH